MNALHSLDDFSLSVSATKPPPESLSLSLSLSASAVRSGRADSIGQLWSKRHSNVTNKTKPATAL